MRSTTTVYTIDLSELKPDGVRSRICRRTPRPSTRSDDIAIDQAVIGSCTNGRIDDMRIAAEILKGRKVAKGVRCIVIPATQDIYLQAMREGLLEIFIEAGAIVSTPTCGPCLGGYMGILAAGRALHLHHQPQLCGPYGPCGFRNLPGEPGGCGGQRSDRQDFGPGRIGIMRRYEEHESTVDMYLNMAITWIRTSSSRRDI